MYIYLGTHYIEIQFFGARYVEDYVINPRWGICSLRIMSLIPVGECILSTINTTRSIERLTRRATKPKETTKYA